MPAPVSLKRCTSIRRTYASSANSSAEASVARAGAGRTRSPGDGGAEARMRGQARADPSPILHGPRSSARNASDGSPECSRTAHCPGCAMTPSPRALSSVSTSRRRTGTAIRYTPGPRSAPRIAWCGLIAAVRQPYVRRSVGSASSRLRSPWTNWPTSSTWTPSISGARANADIDPSDGLPFSSKKTARVL
jgi:hypothetical protein